MAKIVFCQTFNGAKSCKKILITAIILVLIAFNFFSCVVFVVILVFVILIVVVVVLIIINRFRKFVLIWLFETVLRYHWLELGFIKGRFINAAGG